MSFINQGKAGFIIGNVFKRSAMKGCNAFMDRRFTKQPGNPPPPPYPVDQVWLAASYDRLTFELQQEVIGVGGHYTTHTADIYSPDHEGVYHKFGINEPVWEGFRVGDSLVEINPNPEFVAGIDGYSTAQGSLSYFGGKLRWDMVDANSFIVMEGMNITTGVDYEVTIDVTSDKPLRYNVYTQGGFSGDIINGSGVITFTATGTGSLFRLYVLDSIDGSQCDFAKISVKEVAGNTYYADDGAGVLLNPLPRLKYQKAATNKITDSIDVMAASWINGGTTFTYTYNQVGIRGISNTGCLGIGHGQAYHTWSNQTRIVLQTSFKKTTGAVTFPGMGAATISETNNYGFVIVNTDTGEWYPRPGQWGPHSQINIKSNGEYWTVTMLIVSDVPRTFWAYSVTIAAAEASNPTVWIPTLQGECIFDGLGASDDVTFEEAIEIGPIFTSGTAAATDETIYNWGAANHDDIGNSYEGDFKLSGLDQVLLSMGGVAVLEVKDGGVGQVISLSDETNECSVPVVSTEPHIKASYGAGGMTLDVDGVTNTSPYDGSLGAGVLSTKSTSRRLLRAGS